MICLAGAALGRHYRPEANIPNPLKVTGEFKPEIGLSRETFFHSEYLHLSKDSPARERG